MKTMLSKIKIVVLALACVMLGVFFFVGDKGEVKADDLVFVTNDTNVGYAYVSILGSEVTKGSAPKLDVVPEGYLFAGWYTEAGEAVKSSHSIDEAATYRAKYIPEEVLGVKAQLSEDGKNLRFVSSVDELSYSQVGFILEYNGTKYSNDSKDVFRRIKAVTKGDEYNYSPKVVDTDSEYFITAIWRNVTSADQFYVRAYFKTMDGVEVVGPSRYISAAHADTSYINLAVKGLLEEVNSTPTVTATNLPDGITASATVLKAATAEDAYAHVLITLDGGTNKDLKSVTTFDVNGTKVKYRNLYTKYLAAGDEDSSWYTENKGTENEFVIATSADLHGLREIVNNSAETCFKDNTIYVVCDIEVNKGYADPVNLKWDKTIAADGQTPIEGTNLPWTRIGADGNGYRFEGTFDGQMHTISGIIVDTNKAPNGLFGCITSTATIKNFSLINSFFSCSGINLGSIVGIAKAGNLESVYSNAVVKSSAANVGGMVGQSSLVGFTMNNCCFDGSVTYTGTGQYVGGLIGMASDDTEISNCLNSGDISVTASSNPKVGGLVGATDVNEIYIRNSLNTGTINVQEGATQNFGLIIGRFGNYATNSTRISNTYTTEQEGISYVYSKNGQEVVSDYTLAEEDIYGTAAMDKMPQLFTLATADDIIYWAVTENTPVLASFKEYATDAEGNAVSAVAFDTSWYDVNKDTYTLNDASDLYGFAMLSKLADVNGFAGKTIKLGANIVIPNTGDATSWASTAPKFEWIGIGMENLPFAGDFNGNGKTISGICMNNMKFAGLFCQTSAAATVKNFSLTNSYFETNQDFLGSIAGQGRGIFDTIYSDAIVVGNKQGIGGLIGRANGTDSMSISNCWFDGSVTNNGNSTANRNTGGLIGRVQCPTTITNCLNTGTISAPNYTTQENPNPTDETVQADYSVRPYVGGLIGFLTNKTTLTLSYCLNAGEVTYNKAATVGYGSILGRADSSVTIYVQDGVYATTSSCAAVVSNGSVSYSELVPLNVHVVDSTIEGDAATETALFDFANAGVWTTVENSTPVLACFADKATSGTATTPTSMQSAIQEGQGNVIDKGTISSSIVFTDDSNKDAVTQRQGGCYVVEEDGTTYYYQAFFSYYYNTLLDKQDNNNDGDYNNLDNKVVIVKYDYDTKQEVMRSEELALCHANDMTYNDKLGLLVVAHANDDMHVVSFVDPATLTVVRTKWIDGLSYYSIDYNSTYDCYVVQTGAENGVGHNLVILNGNMEVIAKYENGGLYTDPKEISASAGQGLTCDDKYIYCLFSGSSLNNPRTHAITVFDWNGNYVTEISFVVDDEPESLSIVGNQILVNVAGESKVYSITF